MEYFLNIVSPTVGVTVGELWLKTTLNNRQTEAPNGLKIRTDINECHHYLGD